MSFDRKVILITGASSGIGAETARHLAKLGGQIALVGRNQQRLNEVSGQIIASGSPIPLVIVADVNKDAQRIINDTIEYFKRLDVLVNNAGINVPNYTMNAAIDEFDLIMNTNVRSVINLTKLAVPHLEKTRGNIVNVSSVCGMVPVYHSTFYAMSKSALDQFTKCISTELGSKHIRVNSINPGLVRTPIFRTGGYNDEETKRLIDEFSRRYPVGRIGEVSDCSLAIAFLASDNSAFITGTLLRVDGGAVSAGAY